MSCDSESSSGLLTRRSFLLTSSAIIASKLAGAKTGQLRVSPGIEWSIPAPAGFRGGATAKLRGGRILLAYGKPADLRGSPTGTVKLYAVHSEDDGRTWGGERLLIQSSDYQVGRPSFLRTSNGALWLFYYGWIRGGTTTRVAKSDLWAVSSQDDGQTWTAPRCIFNGYVGATNGALQTPAGNIVVPFSRLADPWRSVSLCALSRDDGKTWEHSNTIDIGGYGDHAGALSPAVVELRDGRLWMLIRTNRDRLWQSLSTDGGLTWEPPSASLVRSPNAVCYITRLKSGRLALSWNNTMSGSRVRNELHLALSDDDGKTWREPVSLAQAELISYPWILEYAPGRILLTIGLLRSAGLDTDMLALRLEEKNLLRSEP